MVRYDQKDQIEFKSKKRFVCFCLGKDIDPNSLYNPKPSTMNDNTILNPSLLTQTRPFAQSVRGNPSAAPPPPMLQPLKATKSQTDNRRGNIRCTYFNISSPIYFS